MKKEFNRVAIFKALGLSVLMLLLFCRSIQAQQTVRIEEINKHIGETVKVCTRIYGGQYFNRMQDRPTLLYAGQSFPNQPLNVLIPNAAREAFDDRPEMMYAFKQVCIMGKLEIIKGSLTIMVTEPQQIKLDF